MKGSGLDVRLAGRMNDAFIFITYVFHFMLIA